MKTFHERLTEHENERHAKRMAEISRMQDVLVLAEPVILALEAHLSMELRLDQPLAGWSLGNLNPLYLSSERYSLTEGKLQESLIALGFVEIDRTPYGPFDEVIVTRDVLAIFIRVSPIRPKAIDPSVIPNRRHNDSRVPA